MTISRFGPLRRRSSRSRSRALEGRFREASQRITADLDTARILQAVVDELHRSLGFPLTSIWLVRDGREPPRLAYSVGRKGLTQDPATVPQQVVECASTSRPVQNEIAGMLAFPVITPLSGLVGVLHLAGRTWNVDEGSFVDAVVRQAGLTLEAATLHDRAASESRKSDAILERIADGVVVTDPIGVITQANPAAMGILGADVQMVGRRCEEILALHVGERKLDCRNGCALLASLREGSHRDSVDVWRLQGERRQPLLADVAPVGDPDGSDGLLVHSLRDITKLKQADEAKTLFLATASHELKTPLTVIGGFAQTLLAHSGAMDGPQRSEALGAIERRSRELTSIVNRLLLSSRIEAGRVDLARVELDVAAIVKERSDAVGSTTGRRITVTMDADRMTAFGDSDAVATVTDHLLENAIKYSPNGQNVEVLIGGDADEVRITVRDRGIGMDAEALAHCTDKFWQAESTDVRRFGGTGIGLYIVRSLVEGMGGRLEAESHPGQGTSMTVVLRVTADERDLAAVAVAPQGEPSMIKEFMRQIGVPARRQT